ncbi:MAG: DUF2177 family protein [Phycisphaerales bacterium]|nr:DUF2177 family protein [Phycisphaerales bacterium]
MTFLKAYAGVIVSFLVIDAVWIVLVAKPLYERTLGAMMRETPNFGAAAVFYLAYAAGVVLLECLPAVANASPRTALINGAVIGGLAYGTFATTNYALLKGWTAGLVVSDILWGIAVTAVVAWCGYLVARW